MSSLSEMLAAQGVTVPNPGTSGATWIQQRLLGPMKTRELVRVRDLPRRVPAPVDLTEILRRPGGSMRLQPAQSLALAEAATVGGLLGFLPVGAGKTLLSLLLPTAMGAERPILLVPAGVREQLIGRDLPHLSRHWQIHPELRIVTYEELSRESGVGLLASIRPDLIVADEAHRLRHREAARTRRFLAFCRQHRPRVCAMTGTFSSRSILDWAHLAILALGDGAPVPHDSGELLSWSAALDEKHRSPTGPGALVELATGPEEAPRSVWIRRVFRDRVMSTPGVISWPEDSASAGLVLRSWEPAVPEVVVPLLEQLEERWLGPDGEELATPMDVARVGAQLAMGFHLRWRWGPEGPDYEWLDARNSWNREVRRYLLSGHAPEGMDTPMLLWNACVAWVDRGHAAKRRPPPAVLAAFEPWRAVRDRPEPPVDPVWHSYAVVFDAGVWAQLAPTIVWYHHGAVGEALEAAGLVVFGPGPAAARELRRLAESELAGRISIACSIDSRGTGWNLQAWARNLVLQPPASGQKWEQLLGRTHRQGQAAELVTVDVARHTAGLRKAVDEAIRDARWQEDTEGLPKKLTRARLEWRTE